MPQYTYFNTCREYMFTITEQVEQGAARQQPGPAHRALDHPGGEDYQPLHEGNYYWLTINPFMTRVITAG